MTNYSPLPVTLLMDIMVYTRTHVFKQYAQIVFKIKIRSWNKIYQWANWIRIIGSTLQPNYLNVIINNIVCPFPFLILDKNVKIILSIIR